jgi:hypothetical protein
MACELFMRRFIAVVAKTTQAGFVLKIRDQRGVNRRQFRPIGMINRQAGRNADIIVSVILSSQRRQ